MLTKFMTAAVLGMSLTAIPAFAQTAPKTDNPPPAAKSEPAPAPKSEAAPSKKSEAAPSTKTSADAKSAKTTKSDVHETASSKGLWQASKMDGVDVYNPQNEKIGDIKELMLNKQGQVDTAVIGVGGFLGMGEHDVAVKWSDLKFSDEPVKKTTTSSNAARPAGAPAQTMGAANSTSTTTSKKNYPDHAVLNATKDQLKAMPQFDYSK